jgi:hypothetical protein
MTLSRRRSVDDKGVSSLHTSQRGFRKTISAKGVLAPTGTLARFLFAVSGSAAGLFIAPGSRRYETDSTDSLRSRAILYRNAPERNARHCDGRLPT